MTINVDGGLGLPAAQTTGVDRQQAQARQQRWLYELEHAMLSHGGKKHGPARAHGEPGPARPDSPSDAGRAATGAGATDDAMAALAGQMAGSGSGSGAPPAPAAVVAAPGALPPVARGHGPAAAEAPARAAGPALPPGAGTAPVPAWPAAATPPMMPGAAWGAYGASALPLAGATLAAEAGDAGGQSVAALKAGAAGRSALLLPGGAPGAMPARPAPLARPEADGGPEAAPAHSQGAPGGDDYAARLLHVYRGADGVQAWVRDTELGPLQAQRLAQAMAAELGETGTRLAALTVNGKKQAVPAAPGGARPAAPAAGDDAMASAAPVFFHRQGAQ